jgi:heat shock protein HslJ
MIVEINDIPIKFDDSNKKDKYTLYFYEKGRFSAMAGCNTLGGSYEQGEGNTISFSKILSTMMVCEDMKAERSFSTVLAKVNNFTINDNVLALRATTKILVKLQEIK